MEIEPNQLGFRVIDSSDYDQFQWLFRWWLIAHGLQLTFLRQDGTHAYKINGSSAQHLSQEAIRHWIETLGGWEVEFLEWYLPDDPEKL